MTEITLSVGPDENLIGVFTAPVGPPKNSLCCCSTPASFTGSDRIGPV